LFSGVPGVSSAWDTVASSVLGLRSIYPVNVPISVNPLIPYSIYSLNVPNIVRNDLNSLPINLRDVYNKPILMILKSKTGVEGLAIYLLENGLSSVADNPQTRSIYDAIEAGDEKTAVVINPTILYNTPAFRILKDMPVVRLEVPAGIKFENLVNAVTTNIPYVFINDNEDVGTFDFEGLIRVGSLDISDGRIICRSCY
jgi:hypothetical protein